jgi:uncharacterized protein
VKTRPLPATWCIVAAAWLCATASAWAQGDAMEQLKAKFQARAEKLDGLKRAGQIGETAQGYVEAPPAAAGNAEAAGVVAAENNDRRALYDLIARRQGVGADKVAERNARRNFEKAAPGELLKGADGVWRTK